MTGALLETIDVTRSFAVGAGVFSKKQALKAVNGVSLRVDKGDVLGLVGESGCGKSTLALMLLGLLPASSGNILFDGKPVSHLPRLELARRIQPIFQDPYSSLNPRKSIGDIISLPLRVHGASTAAERQRKVDEIMELVGLPQRYITNYPSQLSGGQRGWKVHPAGGSIGLGNSTPSWASGTPSPGSGVSTEASSACV